MLDSGVSMTCNAVEVRIGSGEPVKPGLTVCVQAVSRL